MGWDSGYFKTTISAPCREVQRVKASCPEPQDWKTGKVGFNPGLRQQSQRSFPVSIALWSLSDGGRVETKDALARSHSRCSLSSNESHENADR